MSEELFSNESIKAFNLLLKERLRQQTQEGYTPEHDDEHEDGELALLRATGAKCEVLGKMKVCGKTWSHPALANGRLYVRDKCALYCYSME